MDPTPVDRLLRQSDVTPLVRATRTQLEVEFLPPYGDPEVSIPGEVATYLVVAGVAVAALDRLRE